MKNLFSLIAILFLSQSLFSEEVLNETVYWELTRVDTKIEEKKFDEAEDILRRWYKKNWRSRSYNKAVIARTYGFFLFQRERFDEALEKLQTAYDENALPLAEATSLVQAMAQLYSTQGNVSQAKKLLLDFIDKAESNPKPVPGMHNVYAITALIFASEKDYDVAYDYINLAISLSSTFREDWYQLKFAIEYNKEDFLKKWESVNKIVFDIVNDLDGSFSAEHGIGKLKREELKFYNPEIEINLMKSIKNTFDPNNILNPGKVL